jgi:hypothetical protein
MINITDDDRSNIQELIQYRNAHAMDRINPISVQSHDNWRQNNPDEYIKWWNDSFITIDGHMVSYHKENHPMIVCKHLSVATETGELPAMEDVALILAAFTINSASKALAQLQGGKNSPNILDYDVNDILITRSERWETNANKIAVHIYCLDKLRSISKIAAVNIGPNIIIDSTITERSARTK